MLNMPMKNATPFNIKNTQNPSAVELSPKASTIDFLLKYSKSVDRSPQKVFFEHAIIKN